MKYIDNIFSRYKELKCCKNDILKAVRTIILSINSGNKLIVCGNRGSAADSEHIVGELLKGFIIERPLSEIEVSMFKKIYPENWEEICKNLQKAVPAISLVSQYSFLSAFANDKNIEFGYAQQIYGLGVEGDILLCISTSGSSKNIINASMVAKVKGLKVISLTGKSGGLLKKYSDIIIKVPSEVTYEIQELHIPVYHAICAELEELLFKGN